MLAQEERSRGPDADAVLRIGKLTLYHLRNSDTGSQKPIELLEVLLDGTNTYIQDGVSIDKAQFTAVEINARMKGHAKGKDGADTARNYVNSNLEKLQVLLNAQQNEIDQLLRQSGQSHRLAISKIGSQGGSGNKAYLYLDLQPLDTIAPDAPQKIPAHFVRYRVQQLLKLPFWAKPFARFSMVGLPLWIYLSGIVLAIGAILFLTFSGLYLRPLFLPVAALV